MSVSKKYCNLVNVNENCLSRDGKGVKRVNVVKKSLPSLSDPFFRDNVYVCSECEKTGQFLEAVADYCNVSDEDLVKMKRIPKKDKKTSKSKRTARHDILIAGSPLHLTDQQYKIYMLIKEKPLTVQQLIKPLDLSISRVRSHLNELPGLQKLKTHDSKTIKYYIESEA